MITFKDLVVVGYLALFAACPVGADDWKNESGKGDRHKIEDKHQDHKNPGGYREQDAHKERGNYFQRHGYSRLNIPAGHYPPPGECRVWFPDRPPGHQPPPGRCGPVPPGAWLIRHPGDSHGHVHVTVYDEVHRSNVLVVGEFEIATGAFIRVILGN